MAHVLFVDSNQSGFDVMYRALELGYEITFIGSRSLKFYEPSDRVVRSVLERAVQVIEIESTADVDGLFDVVRNVAARSRIDAVVGLNETCIETTAVVCSLLGVQFASIDGVRNARNKAQAREILRRAELDSTSCILVHDEGAAVEAAHAIGYPVIVKPVSGADSIMTWRAENLETVRSAARAIMDSNSTLPVQIREMIARGIVVERYVPGTLVSVEVGVLDGKFYHFMVSGRSMSVINECIEVGSVMPAGISEADQAACFAFADKVCAALGLDLGIFHIEMMVNESGPVFIEANPRLMGGMMNVLFQLVTGENISDYLLKIHLGEAPSFGMPEIRRVAASRKLMPAVDAEISRNDDLSWIKREADVTFVNHKIRLGTKVKELDIIGRIFVYGNEWRSVSERADAILTTFERDLGIPLHHGQR